MATRNVTVDLTGDWVLLSTLIAAQDVNLSKLTNCQSLRIQSPSSNADGTKVQITAELVNKDILVDLLKEESYPFENQQCYNKISTIDKMLRIVDAADAGTNGSARIVLNFA